MDTSSLLDSGEIKTKWEPAKVEDYVPQKAWHEDAYPEEHNEKLIKGFFAPQHSKPVKPKRKFTIGRHW